MYYNDFIVTEIINKFRDREALVIYLPDHAEAVYDEGTGFAGHIEENANRHMIEIPLIFGLPKSSGPNIRRSGRRLSVMPKDHT